MSEMEVNYKELLQRIKNTIMNLEHDYFEARKENDILREEMKALKEEVDALKGNL